MKKYFLIYCSFTVLSFLLATCQKSGIKEMTTPAPIYFEVINKDGQSIISSMADTISVSYIDNNVSQKFNLTIMNMETLDKDASGSLKYNGLCILDNAKMTGLSSRATNPIRNFKLSFKGSDLGMLYLDYLGYLNAYPKPASPALTFNDVQVTGDNSVVNTAGGRLNLNLLQLR